MLLAKFSLFLTDPFIFKEHSWRKYRIEIHSESIRTIPIHSDIYIQANANHSEQFRKTFCISFDENMSKINPTQSD